jgi:hypothetical protein
LRVHFAVEVHDQFSFVVADQCGILPKITGTEDATRKLLELLGFNGAEKPQTDLGPIRNLLQRNASFLTESGKIQGISTGKSGGHGSAGLS